MKENGFETMIVKYLVENNHYEEGSNSDYNKIYAIDEVRLFRFLHDTQYEKLAELRIEDNEIEKKKFLDRLSKKISDDGVINIIRKGMKYKNKGLSDIKAVQTLSRLNRCYPNKNEVFVLDFQNDPADIKTAFDKYYKTTILSGETDVNKLNDLVDEMEPLDVYSDEEVTEVAELYLDNADRTKIDPIIDKGTERYKELEYDDQVDFKSSAKTFLRTYNFLSSILPYGSMDWERLSIYLTFLVSKLPKPDNGNADEIMEDVELESYRLVAQDTISIKLEDKDSEIEPIPVKTDVGIPVPELDTLSNILASFHEMWGNCEWTDENRIRKQIAELPDIVEQDETYQNAMKYSDAQNARDESDRATYDAILKSLVSGTELYKAFSDDIRNKNNQSFKKWLLDYVFNVTYKPESRE